MQYDAKSAFNSEVEPERSKQLVFAQINEIQSPWIKACGAGRSAFGRNPENKGISESRAIMPGLIATIKIKNWSF